MIRFSCPKCQTVLQAAEQAGAVVACPRCQAQVRVPSPKVVSPPAVPASRPDSAAAPTPWYYARGGERHGPFTTAQLKQLAQTGELQPTDSVWKEGMPTWRPASDVKGLFSATQPKAKNGPPPLPTLAENGSASSEGLAESAGHSQAAPADRALKSGGLLGSPMKLALIGAAVAVPLLVVAAVGVFLAVRSGSATGTKADSQRASTSEARPKDKDREKGPAGGYAARAFKATGKQPPKDFKPSPPSSTDDFLDALEILGLRPGNKFDSKPYAWIPIRGRGVTEALWVEVFGQPRRLSDGYDTLGKSRIAYQRLEARTERRPRHDARQHRHPRRHD